jgi:hypothetical protein
MQVKIKKSDVTNVTVLLPTKKYEKELKTAKQYVELYT